MNNAPVPNTLPKDLENLRSTIDDLDKRIVALLNQRAGVVIDIGKAKRQGGGTSYVPNRERDVLDRILKYSDGPLPDRSLLAIYRELMSGSLALERPPRIAYLGPAGSFSHLAATKKFGASVEYEALGHIGAVFEEVERSRVELGLVPIENSIGGGVAETLDALIERDVTVCGEVNLAVHLHLLGCGPVDEIEVVHSKPEAFAQCSRWLTERGLIRLVQQAPSTSKAAEFARDNPKSAAIGSRLAAEVYGIDVLADSIEDSPNNVTRFLVLSKTPAKPTSDDKTAIYFHAADRPGALVQVLEAFRSRGVNMTFIQSRPARKRGFEYAFFVDMQGSGDSPEIAAALEETNQHCSNLKVLGSFPRSQEVV
jgi:chorismate mutase / prephenate dehydratase